MASDSLHENPAKLGPEIIDQHRAIVSLMEELEAVDWYNQRAKATENPELRAILEHNRDEEKEHAAMVLEWLRQQDPVLDAHMRACLFQRAEPPLPDATQASEAPAQVPAPVEVNSESRVLPVPLRSSYPGLPARWRRLGPSCPAWWA